MFGIRSYRAGAFKRPSNPTDTETVGRLRLTLLCGVFSAATAFSTPALAADPADTPAPPAAVALPVVATARPGANWAAPQIASVVVAGVMGPDVASFRPDDSLTRGELHDALVALGKPHAEPTDPSRIVTMRELDAQLVAAAGLLPSAREMRLAALAGGLEPTDMLGTETIARLLGLRINHPVGQEDLERSPKQPASRAEAAYSLAKLRLLDPTRIDAVRQVAATFSVPALGEWQRLVLSRALRFVGYPYVFAGSSEKPQTIWSTGAPNNQLAVPGGFDCSGFVWRVFKLQSYEGAPSLADVLKGRTTYAMSGEVGKAKRIAPAFVQPGDVLFFGGHGTQSKPSEIGHSGIYVGNGWFVHSSSGGVTLQPLQGWYADELAWARRPLAEAGLTA
jgi:cell wall-associated NlpC family hydrolase